jgi:hypothetical protein
MKSFARFSNPTEKKFLEQKKKFEAIEKKLKNLKQG